MLIIDNWRENKKIVYWMKISNHMDLLRKTKIIFIGLTYLKQAEGIE